jgi:hypothetical protein
MKLFFWLLSSVLMVSACQNSGQSGIMTPKAVDQPSAEFMDFYKKFLSDSAYQVAHITWPLQGTKQGQVDTNGIAPKILMEWQPETWLMHHDINFDNNPDYTRHFEVLGDEVVMEYIKTRAMHYGMERRFVKDDKGEWSLIYYADMQEMR